MNLLPYISFLSALSLALTTQQASAGVYFGADTTPPAPLVVIDESGTAEELYFAPHGYSAPHAPSKPPAASVVISTPPQAQILLPAPTHSLGGKVVTPSVILADPTATSSPELSRQMQFSHAWSIYQGSNNSSGLGLIYAPSYNAQLSASQKSARGNRSRAQGFRLDYYK